MHYVLFFRRTALLIKKNMLRSPRQHQHHPQSSALKAQTSFMSSRSFSEIYCNLQCYDNEFQHSLDTVGRFLIELAWLAIQISPTRLFWKSSVILYQRVLNWKWLSKKNTNKSESKQNCLAFFEICMTNLVAFWFQMLKHLLRRTKTTQSRHDVGTTAKVTSKLWSWRHFCLLWVFQSSLPYLLYLPWPCPAHKPHFVLRGQKQCTNLKWIQATKLMLRQAVLLRTNFENASNKLPRSPAFQTSAKLHPAFDTFARQWHAPEAKWLIEVSHNLQT